MRLTAPKINDLDYYLWRIAEGDRPSTRGDCSGGARPCPWVSCRYHLLNGINTYEWRERNDDQMVGLLFEMPETCALDTADQGAPLTLQQIGELMLFSKERTRQLIGVDTGAYAKRSPICKLQRMAKAGKPELENLHEFYGGDSDREYIDGVEGSYHREGGLF